MNFRTLILPTVALALGAGIVAAVYQATAVDPTEKIRECKSPRDPTPTIVVEQTFESTVDVRHMVAYTEARPIEPGFPNGNPAKKIVLLPPKDATTRIDLALNLNATDRVAAKIIVNLPDGTMSFMTSDDLGITSSDSHRGMFCRGSISKDKVVYQVNYVRSNYDYKSSINYNIIVKDSDATTNYTLPITIDPQVKNHG